VDAVRSTRWFAPLAIACLVVLGAASSGVASAKDAIHIRGGRFIGVNGKPIRLIGVDRSGTEYACTSPLANGSGWGFGIFQGPTDERSIRALLSWDVDAVALPLNEACWLGGFSILSPQFSGASYRNAIVRYVNALNRNGIYVVIRLSGVAPGADAPYGSVDTSDSTELPMADADHSLAFWSSVGATFRNNPMVVFHTYDEPHAIGWRCLLNGCTVNDVGRYGKYRTTGQQQMVTAIRRAGARQPIVISGPNFAADLSGWKRYMPRDPRHQLAADISSFDYGDYVLGHESTLRSFARSHPVIVGGFGDTHCTSAYSRKVMAFMDSIHQSYLAWTWNTVQDYGGCSNALLDDPGAAINGQPRGYYSGTPSGYGVGVRNHYRALNPHARFG
jgi:hypothetical protein